MLGSSSSRVTVCLPWCSALPWPSGAVCCQGWVMRWAGPWLWPATDVLVCCLGSAQPPEKAFSLTTFKNWLKMALLQLVCCSWSCELRTITYGKGFWSMESQNEDMSIKNVCLWYWMCTAAGKLSWVQLCLYQNPLDGASGFFDFEAFANNPIRRSFISVCVL